MECWPGQMLGILAGGQGPASQVYGSPAYWQVLGSLVITQPPLGRGMHNEQLGVYPLAIQ